MHLYRFRVTCEGEDEFVRDIDITPGQTFEILLDTIKEAAEFPGEFSAIFYTANARWVRQKEIAGEPVKGVIIDPDDDDVRVGDGRRIRMPFYPISNARLKDFIEDPHQHILLEYHANEFKLFYIELLKIHSVDDGSNYPRCVLKKGDIGYRKVINTPIIKQEDELEKILGKSIALPGIHEDVDDDLIEEDIEALLEDETFSKIIAGESPEPASAGSSIKRGRKTSKIEENLDEDESTESFPSSIIGDDDVDDDDSDYGAAEDYDAMDDDEFEKGGYQIKDFDD